MFKEEAQGGEFPVLSGCEQRGDAVHIAEVVIGSSLQQHLTYLHVVSEHSFMQSRPALNAAGIHLCSMIQQPRHDGSVALFACCRRTKAKK